MRILFILEYYYPHVGGVETLFKSLTESLSKKGIQATVLTQRFDRSLPKREEINGVTIIRLPIKNRYLFTVLAIFPAIWHAFKHNFIHTTSYNAGIPSFFAGLISRKKVIITFHEVWSEMWFRLPFFSKLSLRGHYCFEWLLLKFPFHHYIAVSDFTKNRLIEAGIPSKKITRIYNGLDYSEFEEYQVPEIAPATQASKTNFLYFGRLGISKGIDIILDAVVLMKEQTDDFNLTLIIPKTPKPLLDAILDRISKYHISQNINIIHSLPWTTLLESIRDTDVVIIPSYSEGFGYTAAESVAMNKRIISSQNGALSEVVSGEYIHFSPFDGHGLATAMSQAMLGQFDHKERKSFHLDTTVVEYIRFYENLNS